MIECKVSIIVPIYNVEKYLDRCLKSIVNQTYKNLEIILVDDGSTDSSAQKCDYWAENDHRIIVIHKKNQGLGFARNTGIDEATGKYIFFFDSDDYVSYDIVEKCVSSAQKNDADTVVYCRNNVYSDGTIEKQINNVFQFVYEFEEIKNVFLPNLFDYGNGFGVSAWSKMFSLDLIKKNRIAFVSERDIISEDAMFCLEYFSKSIRLTVLPDNLYYYFKNANSLTRTYKSDRFLRNNEFLIKCTAKAKDLELPTQIYSHIAARYHGMTLGALAQIINSNLEKKVKRKTIRSIYRDIELRETLKWKIIKLDAFLPQIFWVLLKFKCYLLCDALLYFNKYRNS